VVVGTDWSHKVDHGVVGTYTVGVAAGVDDHHITLSWPDEKSRTRDPQLPVPLPVLHSMCPFSVPTILCPLHVPHSGTILRTPILRTHSMLHSMPGQPAKRFFCAREVRLSRFCASDCRFLSMLPVTAYACCPSAQLPSPFTPINSLTQLL